MVGLGNPGSQYTATRHNIGFMVLEQLASKKQVKFSHAKKLHGNLAEVELGKIATRVLMPNTYMNESGRAIRATLDWFDIEINQIFPCRQIKIIYLSRLGRKCIGFMRKTSDCYSHFVSPLTI